MTSVEASAIRGSISPAVTGIGAIWQFFKHKYDYVKKVDKNFKGLKEAEEFLDSKKSTLEQKLGRNEILKELTEDGKTWLLKVGQIKDEVEGLKTSYENIRQCCCGTWPFFKLMKVSRDMLKKKEELKTLETKIENLNDVIIERKPEPVEPMFADTEDDIPPTHSKIVEKLIKFLRDEDVNRIGIWGTPGVGKSTILKKINDQVYEMGMFDIVIWVAVQEEDSVRKIQLDILARLKQSVADIDSKVHVAATVSKALGKWKYLLLLDQVPMEINLDEVGIRGKHKYGKVIIASRNKLDCKRMDIQQVIKVSKLSYDDAWTLFRKIVGDIADYPHIKQIAKRIVRELGGVPFTIKAVAATLINEPEFAWWGALWTLQSPAESQLKHFKELFAAFKLSYNRLPDDRKKCLLYGSLFPKDYEIDKDYLMECWRSEQFINEIQLAGGEENSQKLRASRDRGHSILQDLTEASLFEWSSRANFLTMPAVFRTMALDFHYPQEEGCSLLVRAKNELACPPEMEKWRDARRISLMCNKICSLINIPECPKITTLLLQRNKQLEKIHDSFFSYMPELRVLDLYRTGIPSLPSSITKLVNVKALYLNECLFLVTLSKDIVALKNLEILDIRDTGMQKLPIEVGQLLSLRCLRVSFIYKPLDTKANENHHTSNEDHQQTRKIIPPHVIDNLHQLEELTIIVDTRDRRWNYTAGSVVKEIANLRNVTTLFFYFPNINSLTYFIMKSHSWNNTSTMWMSNSFRSFQFIVGPNRKHHKYGLDSSRGPAERHVRFSADKGIFSEGIKTVLRQASAFELIANQEIQILSDIGTESTKSLEVCIVEGCHRMNSITSCNLAANENAFPFLEKLHLVNLQGLLSICDGPVGPKSFSNLTILTLQECNKLGKVFTLALLKQFKTLQHVRIENCSGIVEVIETQVLSEEENDVEDLSGILPNLEILELVGLTLLTSICTNDSLDWRSLHKIEVKECPILNSLPKGMYNAKHLSRIECTENWWGQIPENETKILLQRRCHFISEEPIFCAFSANG